MEGMVDQVHYEVNGDPQSVLKSKLSSHSDDATPVESSSPPNANSEGEILSSHPNQDHTSDSNEETLETSTAQDRSPNLVHEPQPNSHPETDMDSTDMGSTDHPSCKEDESSHHSDNDEYSSRDKPGSPLVASPDHSHDVDVPKEKRTDLDSSQTANILGDETARLPPSPLVTMNVVASEDVAVSDSAPPPGDSNGIPVVTQARGEVDESGVRTDCVEKSDSQTSFVNEYALSSSESPTYEVDRNLEQFSEILLDSDPSPSDTEPLPEDTQPVATTEEVPSPKKKNAKKVRFADEVTEGSQRGHSSPPPPPSTLPTHPSPSTSSKHPGVPITPSPTSPKQKVPYNRYTVDQLINGVEILAEYLGSTPIILDGLGAMKSARMFQAQQAVQLIKDPESESRPHFAVKLKVSTEAIRIADSSTDTDLMDHPLHTITYVADIDRVLVIMAHIRPPPVSSPAHRASNGTGEPVSSPVAETKYIPKMTCHVLDTANAREAAVVIGQAFSAAYKQFLRSSGITDQQLEQAEYAHILNAQSVPKLEVESLGDRNKIKKLTLAKHKNEIMGMMVMESGYGSAIPACVIVHLSKTGAGTKCGLLNVGDHILSINGVNLVGMPRKACLEQIKKCRYMNVVKMEVCSCPTVVDVTIVRPDLKYQLGFSVHEGMICSLVRGSIAERSGVRVGHIIIDINGTSAVGMRHADIVHLLSSTVGDLHIRMMPDIMYRLLTGKLQPDYC